MTKFPALDPNIKMEIKTAIKFHHDLYIQLIFPLFQKSLMEKQQSNRIASKIMKQEWKFGS